MSKAQAGSDNHRVKAGMRKLSDTQDARKKPQFKGRKK